MGRPKRPGHPYFAGAPLLMAHRGGGRLAPENTMAAFSQAVDQWGADVLEMDVRRTGDGRVVVIHDATVDRTTDGAGAVADKSWGDLKPLDAGVHFKDLNGQTSFGGKGVRIPLFEEVLDAFPHVRLNVESKVPEVAGPLIDIIRDFGAEHRVLVAAEFEPTRKDARGYEGPWGASRRHVAPFWVLHRIPFVRKHYRSGADAFQVPEMTGPFRLVTRRFIEAAHAANIPVHVWTVDEEEDMRRLLEWGVDGIQSDRPDRLAEVLEDVAGRAPAPCRRKGEK